MKLRKNGTVSLPIILAGLFLFHVAISLAMSGVAFSPYLTDYHNGAGLWNFALDSFFYHDTAITLSERFEDGRFREWWDGTSQPHIRLLAVCYAVIFKSPIAFAPFNALAWSLGVVLVWMTASTITGEKSGASMWAGAVYGLWPSNLILSTQLLKDPYFNLGCLMTLLGVVAILSGRKGIVYPIVSAVGFAICLSIRLEAMPFILISVFLALTISVLWRSSNRKSAYYMVAMILLVMVVKYLVAQIPKENVDQPAISSTQKSGRSDAVQNEPVEHEKIVEQVYEEISAIAGVDLDSKLKHDIEVWLFDSWYTEAFTMDERKSILLALAGEHGVALQPMLQRLMSRWSPSDIVPWTIERYLYAAVMYRDSFVTFYLVPGGSVIDTEIVFRSLGDVVLYAPRAVQVSLLAPFPSQWMEQGKTGGGAIRILGGIEMLAWYIICAGFIVFLIKFKAPVPVKIWLALFILITVVPLGYFVPNIGTLFRMRHVYLSPALIGGVIILYGLISSRSMSKNVES